MTNPNDPAFAYKKWEERSSALQAGREPIEVTYPGLTKREYFAALAMQGFAGADWTKATPAEELALYAVELADALIAELNK